MLVRVGELKGSNQHAGSPRAVMCEKGDCARFTCLLEGRHARSNCARRILQQDNLLRVLALQFGVLLVDLL